jgi:hypothetical protein
MNTVTYVCRAWLIQADGREFAEVKALDRAGDIMLDDAPQPCKSDRNVTRVPDRDVR